MLLHFHHRYEIRDIRLPERIQEAMQMQVRFQKNRKHPIILKYYILVFELF